jgi:hypothetical protein
LPKPNKPIFLLLLPLFFVLHGINEQHGFIPFKDAALLLLLYLIAATALFGLCRLFLNNNSKAALASFLLLSFHFFFGSMHDQLKSIFNESTLTKYSVILPFFLLAFIALFIWLRRKKTSVQRLGNYLNLLLIVLVAWEAISLLLPKQSSQSLTQITLLPCDTCARPDIYLILLDEYAGNTSLKDLFAFDNAPFEDQLRQRGFHVVNESRSNYNYTPFSIASMLNMSYLQLNNTQREKPDVAYALRLISNNAVRQLLESKGYEFFNYSGFDMAGHPTPIEETFMPAKTRLITSQTFLSRIERDLGYHFIQFSPATKRAYRELHNNTKLYDLTKKIAAQQHNKPRFIYTHLMMPHYPYYFDRNGQAMDAARVLPEINNQNRKDYVEYLQYTNKKVLELADHILKHAPAPPVIIIMSDHGFRHFAGPVRQEYYFMNFNAVYLPQKNYQAFYDGFTNVNQFRALFNTLFAGNYPLLKDSSIYLKD